MPKSGSMSHANKTCILSLQETPWFKKPEGQGWGQWSLNAMKLATARRGGGAVAWWQGLGFGVGIFQVLNPIPLCGARCELIHTQWPNAIQLVWVWSLETGGQVEMSLSPSDCGSKLRDPSQNSPRVASKRGFNITKLN
ncbi:hypothetical protein AVEN_239004-1 [Araneus ventricosus]|uniref:Uncharacterized protein n=1 Tax=Araneus ventricosus TaxID=182803 RepID=A0A4Y2TGK5_ARAVE|nr:hypothetical protein AVEN_239004-1 [Araneus ventricosus]